MLRDWVGDTQGDGDRERPGLEVDGVDLAELVELVSCNTATEARGLGCEDDRCRAEKREEEGVLE
jgi:hypothetical protein